MIESQDSCLTSSDRSTGSRGRNSVLLWYIDPMRMEQQKEWCRPWRVRWRCTLQIRIRSIRKSTQRGWRWPSIRHRIAYEDISHFTWSTVGTHDRPWKRLRLWEALNDVTKIQEDGVTIYNVITREWEKPLTISYGSRSSIGLIDTSQRKDLMKSKLDRKRGSIWIGWEMDIPESWHICGTDHSKYLKCAEDTRCGCRFWIHRIDFPIRTYIQA